MRIVVGVDGTGGDINPGAARDRRYDVAFANSFVSKIAKGDHNKKYLRGPVLLGGGLIEAMSEGRQFVLDKHKASGGDLKVLMTGYSRGAGAVVDLSKWLERENIEVEALLLFDCVDRAGDIDPEIIPRNVKNVMHVIRDPATSSRESFGNDGLRYYPESTKYEPVKKFFCTHGGMGGCPWPVPPGKTLNDFVDEEGYDGMTKVTFAKDRTVSQEVWRHVSPFILKHQFMTRTD